MLKLVMLAGLMLLFVIVAAATRLMPHGTAAETATPQQVYFRLHNDDDLSLSLDPIIGGPSSLALTILGADGVAHHPFLFGQRGKRAHGE